MRSGAMIGAVAVTLIVLGSAYCAPEKASADSIEKIMELSHTTDTGLRDKIVTEASKDKPDWAAVQKNTKAFMEEINKLPKLTPPNGSKDSWEKKSKAYIELAKGLEAAAEKKDAKAVKAAYEKTGGACKGCHDDHR